MSISIEEREELLSFINKQQGIPEDPKIRKSKLIKKIRNIALRIIGSTIVIYILLAVSFDYLYLKVNEDTTESQSIRSMIVTSYNIKEPYKSDLENLPIIIRIVEKQIASSGSPSDAVEFNKGVGNSNDKEKAIFDKVSNFSKLLFSKNALDRDTAGAYISFKVFYTSLSGNKEFFNLPGFKSFMTVYKNNNQIGGANNQKNEQKQQEELNAKKELIFHEYLHYIFDKKSEQDSDFYLKFSKELDNLEPETKNILDEYTDSYKGIQKYAFTSEQFAYFGSQVCKGNKESLFMKRNPGIIKYYEDIIGDKELK